MNQRRGAMTGARGLAGSVAAAVRRRQQARMPRVLLYDRTGEARVLRSTAESHREVLEVADAMVALTLEGGSAAQEDDEDAL